MTGVTAYNRYLSDKLYKWPELLQKIAYLPDKHFKWLD